MSNYSGGWFYEQYGLFREGHVQFFGMVPVIQTPHRPLYWDGQEEES
jgi:hypothetical protein